MALLALFPLELVLFPGAPLPLHIFEPRYKELIAECLEEKKSFGMVRAKDNAVAEVGCTAIILNVNRKYDDGRLDISTEGKQRFSILELNHDRAFLQAEVTWFDDEETREVAKTEVANAIDLHKQLFHVLGQETEVEENVASLSFHLANALPVDLDFKQGLLEMKSETERLDTLIEYYRATIPQLEKTMRAREKAGGNGHVR